MQLFRQLRRAAVRVQDISLRFGVEERLVLMLAMEIDQRLPEFARERRRGWRAVDPGTAPSANVDLTLQNQPAVLGIDPRRITAPAQILASADVEHRLHKCPVLAGADHVRGRALS